jgi:hypothetical protein
MTTIKQIVTGDYQAATPQERLMMQAYWYGIHIGAKRVCDAARNIFAAQTARAKALRYHRTACAVQGGIKQIYDPAYGDSEIGNWDV